MSDRERHLLDGLFGAAEAEAVFDDRGRLQAMLDVEAALARAEAKVGVIPASAAAAIEAAARAKHFDVADLATAAASAGNLAIPLVKRLTARVAAGDPESARYVHWGATSQDIIDTAAVLQLRALFAQLDAGLGRLAGDLATLAARHRGTPMIARTWLQHALPTTFGLKAAGWLDAIRRERERQHAARSRILVLQFGGAAGTLAALGDKGLAVAAALAEDLGLALPDMPWHGHRDRIAEAATLLGLLTGTLGKIARDVALAMQTEVAELFEAAGEGRGGSSTMPHKRNPVAASLILAAATRAPGLVATILSAMPQEHERAVGGWQAEWAVLPELARLAAGALAHAEGLIAGLEVDAARMRANIDVTQGLVMAEAVQMALARSLGRLAAHDLVERACKRSVQEKKPLGDVLAAEAAVRQALPGDALDRLFAPESYIGATESFIKRVLRE